MSQRIQKLIEYFTKLPGIGPRQATRLVLDMVEWTPIDLEEFAQTISGLREGHLFCDECYNFADSGKCAICASVKRDKTRIAVVEKVTDLQAMEKTGAYNGVYHVLGGAINPAEGVLPEKLKIENLRSRIVELQKLTPDVEIIIATNPTMHGETTALYLTEELKPLNIKITRLARGLSAGSTVEYADETTLAHALKHRR
ncbi:MAG: recombination protein RecR [Candidatus Yanofskybacteria bacterium]|nr:recombination protein RecR [Candidatus Yanofskybacteria bacterium]